MNCSSRKVLIVGVKTEECTYCNVPVDVITAFEVHAPTAGFVRKFIAYGNVELPVDVVITVEGYLRLAGRRYQRYCGKKRYV